MNGQISPNGKTADTRSERPRLEDRPNVSVAELAALQRGYVERLGKLIEQLTAVMSGPIPPTAAIGSPAPASGIKGSRHDMRDERLDKLVRTRMPGGDISYGFRTDAVRSTVAKVLGASRPAFVERAAESTSPYLELVGTNDREIATAIAFAAERCGNDEIIIHVSGRHTAKIIEHAVAQGLNIANRDSYIQALVAQERARQSISPAERGRSTSAASTIAVIECAKFVQRPH